MPPAVPAMAEAGQPAGNNAEADAAAEWEALARQEESQDTQDTPVVDSPSISADWPTEGEGASGGSEADWPSVAREDAERHEDAVAGGSLTASPACSDRRHCLPFRACQRSASPSPARRWARWCWR